MNRNVNGNRRVLRLTFLNDTSEQDEGNAFYDPDDPCLCAAEAERCDKKETWKRKLIGWCFVLVLIGGRRLRPLSTA